MVKRIILSFADDQDGSPMVEMSLVISLLLIVVLGFVDFSRALYQWNQASKAVQMGARLAEFLPLWPATCTRLWTP